MNEVHCKKTSKVRISKWWSKNEFKGMCRLTYLNSDIKVITNFDQQTMHNVTGLIDVVRLNGKVILIA